MTRFARAKGSKSSNERTPEDSTPWEVMKEQLMRSKKDTEDSKKREQAEQQRIENYEKFLKEHKTQKRSATWCDFPESQINILNNTSQSSEPVKKKKKKEKKTKPISEQSQQEAAVSPLEEKKSKQKKNVQANDSQNQENTELLNESKKANKKNKRSNDPTKNSDEQDNMQPNQLENKSKKIKKNKNGNNKGENIQTSNKGNEGQNKNKQKKKFNNGEPIRRKPVNDTSFQLIINGKEIELVRFDGFPVMKKDAERLQELKTNMIKKGIPKSEVQRTLKLERRRAEKALARVKRDVCYNCRKGGHNLSDCPELKTKIPGVGAADGLCFKCGSTEHRQFECKVQKSENKEFRFATCFICKEPGHIARQCPDNPKGLYPNGGSCKLCGDVTHLRKDCPTVQDKREDASIKLQTLESADYIEGITQKTKSTGGEDQVKKPKKITF